MFRTKKIFKNLYNKQCKKIVKNTLNSKKDFLPLCLCFHFKSQLDKLKLCSTSRELLYHERFKKKKN